MEVPLFPEAEAMRIQFNMAAKRFLGKYEIR